MRFTLPAVCLFFLAVGIARAHECTERLDSLSTRSKCITALLDTISHLDGKIEGVPPDVARFIAAEQEAAFKSGNDQRFQLVTRHSYYPAHQVHAAYQSVRVTLEDAKKATAVREQALKLSEANDAYAKFWQAFADYQRFDMSRSKPVLALGDIQTDSYVLPLLQSMISTSLRSAIRQMREPE